MLSSDSNVLFAAIGVAASLLVVEAANAERDTKALTKHFVPEKPPPRTQVQKSSKERGVNPCNTPD